jgi:hypothetical protein
MGLQCNNGVSSNPVQIPLKILNFKTLKFFKIFEILRIFEILEYFEIGGDI